MKNKLRTTNTIIICFSLIALIAIITMPLFGSRLSVREDSCCGRHPVEGCINYCCSSGELCAKNISGVCECIPQ